MFTFTFTPEEAEMLHEEFRDRRPKLFRCSDRMCGNLDCANCLGEEEARAFIESEQSEIERE